MKHESFHITPTLDEPAIWAILEAVNDPEVPVLSVVDLGIVRKVDVVAGRIEITITPTYSGCPAMDAISIDIRLKFMENGIRNVHIQQQLSPAWTTDWMSENGRRKLKAFGIAPPNPKQQFCKDELFAEEAVLLRRVVGDYVVAIEHIGSTAICGILAKPIIDIAVGVEKLTDGEKCVVPLENIGYEYRGEHGIARRFYFVKGEPRTHHLHLVEKDSDFWRSHLLFRDYLRAHPAVAKEYENLKLELARKYANDRDAYLYGKTDFIENVLKIAGF